MPHTYKEAQCTDSLHLPFTGELGMNCTEDACLTFKHLQRQHQCCITEQVMGRLDKHDWVSLYRENIKAMNE